jgi:hypothetical protein
MTSKKNPLGVSPRRTAHWMAILAWGVGLLSAVKTAFDITNNELSAVWIVLTLLLFGLAFLFTLIWWHAKPDGKGRALLGPTIRTPFMAGQAFRV